MRKLCRHLPRSLCFLAVSLALLTAFLPAGSSAQVVIGGSQVACIAPLPVSPPAPLLTPWIYRPQDGSYVWGDHQFWEDPGNTVFSLARDLVAVPAENDPPGARPDVLLFNFAHFDPPEGEPVPAGGTRKLMGASLGFKGLQLLVNYSGARIDAAYPSVRYMAPTFFVSVDGHFQNAQTTPAVPWSGFSGQFVSATRGAFGCAFTAVTPHTAGPSSCDDLYVTAGLGYGLSDLDPDPLHQGMAAEAQTDRLMVRDPLDGRWGDLAQNAGCPGGVRIPASAASGNSSGVAFADLTGDGWADLYVGKPGDRYLGAANVLLVNDGTGCFTDQTATRIPGEPSRATVDVAAADLERDGDLDLIVANRCRQSGACGTESEDYVLINNGAGVFGAPVWLNAGQLTDTRSVAVGQLNSSLAAPDAFPEIVMGNAGTDGFSNNLVLAQDHRMQIFQNLGSNTFADRMDPWLDTNAAGLYPTEYEVTAPHTFQVLLTDLFHPKSTNPPNHTPDGWLDLVIVSHRDILQHKAPFGAASRVYVLANKANWSGPPTYLVPYTAFGSDWLQTVAAADFTGSGFKDLFEGRGSRFAGVLSEFRKNRGSTTTDADPWDYSGGFINDKSYKSMPATEHGYGFDFADVDGDGFLDALQTSRGYDYFAFALDSGNAFHRNLTDASSGTGKTDNRRGRQAPQGMEDGVFADFDRDGDLDALMASQRTPAWPICADVSPDSIVLANTGSGTFGHDSVAVGSCSREDARIDLVNRVSHPGIADRAVAGDLDNDGDVDAIVH
ncbi:MAG TPA: VCBS repeat-containing protein, partial [Thermoanaerobaculia bacterium]|nr:VCBS repeat-containing protein [Thermoanaerobaculia bacterium]